MNCKTCDYPLWNIEARNCPECGSPFLPSQFRFSLNSVRFCCPQCKTAYYGQSDLGHLVPAEFDCVTCARHLKMDEMILLPAAGVAEQLTRGESMPWIERSRLGRVSAWFAMFSRAMSNPGRLISVTPAERPTTEALWFALSVFALIFTVNMSIFFVPGLLSGLGLTLQHGPLGLLTGALLGGGGLLVIIVAVVLLYTATIHMVLLLTGGTNQPFKRTLQCTCYSAPTALLAAIPCLGSAAAPIALIWWYIASAQMLIASHQVRTWRASLAVAVLPTAVLLLLVSIILVNFSSGGRTTVKFGGFSPPTTTTTNADLTDPVAQALKTYASANGSFPRHPLHLIADNPLLSSKLTLINDSEIADGLSFARLSQMTPEQLAAAASEAALRLDPANPLCRAGDYVFACQNLAATPDLPAAVWLTVLLPKGEYSSCVIIKSDFSSEALDRTQMPAAITAQNAVRSAAGLTALPPFESWP